MSQPGGRLWPHWQPMVVHWAPPASSSAGGAAVSGAALASIPMILFFFAFQRYFMQGLRVGAVKG